MIDTDAEQARLDAEHDQAVEQSMRRVCRNCGYVHTQDEACAWECISCGVWNDEDLE